MKWWEKTLAVAALAIVVCIPIGFGAWDGWQRGVKEDAKSNELHRAHREIASLRNQLDEANADFRDKNAEYTDAVKGWTLSLNDLRERNVRLRAECDQWSVMHANAQAEIRKLRTKAPFDATAADIEKADRLNAERKAHPNDPPAPPAPQAETTADAVIRIDREQAEKLDKLFPTP
jgi:hypothetical protein